MRLDVGRHLRLVERIDVLPVVVHNNAFALHKTARDVRYLAGCPLPLETAIPERVRVFVGEGGFRPVREFTVVFVVEFPASAGVFDHSPAVGPRRRTARNRERRARSQAIGYAVCGRRRADTISRRGDFKHLGEQLVSKATAGRRRVEKKIAANRVVNTGDGIRLPQARHEIHLDHVAFAELERVELGADHGLYTRIEKAVVVQPEDVDVFVEFIQVLCGEFDRLAIDRKGVDRAVAGISG